MVEMPKTRYARAGDAHIAYQVFGNGETDLVWMPRWATHIEIMWEQPLLADFLDGVASFSRVVLFDKRGVKRACVPVRRKLKLPCCALFL
jgi:hypothetical protein